MFELNMRLSLVILTLHLVTSSNCLQSCNKVTSSNGEELEPRNYWSENLDSDAKKERYLPTYSFRSIRTHIVQQCSLECELEAMCESYNYNTVDGTCELNSKHRLAVEKSGSHYVLHDGGWFEVTDGLIQLQEWDYYSKDAFATRGKVAYNPCKDVICNENEVCSPLPPKFRTNEIDFVCQTTIPPPSVIYSEWSDWSTWSDCSVTCGLGRRLRVRTCRASETWKCDGISQYVILCRRNTCPHWSHWQAWSYCNTVNHCGEGTRHRIRTCVKEVESHSCNGDDNQTLNCRLPSCDSPIFLSDGTSGRVFIYDDSNFLFPTWKGVCENPYLAESARTSIYRTVCAYYNLHVDTESLEDPDSSPPSVELYLKPEKCDNVADLMMCEHEGWKNHSQCTTQLYVSCKKEFHIRAYNRSEILDRTWDDSKEFCIEKHGRLCTDIEIFPEGGDIPVTGVLNGNYWTPINEEYYWISIGSDYSPPAKIPLAATAGGEVQQYNSILFCCDIF